MSHAKAVGERIAMHLRFDPAQRGRTREAVAFLQRILRHRRLRGLVLANPLCGRLPLVRVWKRTDETDEELRQIILLMCPHLTPYGRFMAKLALDALADRTEEPSR